MRFPELPKWQLIALPLVLVTMGVFYFGKYYVAEELIRANHRIEALQKELQAERDRLDEERSRSTVAEREADVVRRANALLRESERERQDEIANLQADLEFYRRLGGASGSQGPLTVHYLELQPTQSPRVYRVIISLTQNLRWASSTSGSVQLSVDGISDGVAAHLAYKQILAESDKPLSFQFKYFQQLGFEASRLTVRLKSSSLKAPVEQSWEWDSLINRTESLPPEE